MTNGQAIFLGACLIISAGIIGVSLGFTASATKEVGTHVATLFHVIVFFVGIFLAAIGWYAMKYNVEKDRDENQP